MRAREGGLTGSPSSSRPPTRARAVLTLLSKVTGTFIEDLVNDAPFRVGDSVTCVVRRIEEANTQRGKRAVLSLKPSSLNGVGFGKHGELFLTAIFQQRFACRSAIAKASEADDAIPDVTKYPLGRCTDATVLSKRGDGSLVSGRACVFEDAHLLTSLDGLLGSQGRRWCHHHDRTSRTRR